MNQIDQTLKDIIPNYTGNYPPTLLSYISSIYSISTQKLPALPHRADIARYHLCAYLAVDQLRETCSLPVPSKQKIPIQPKFVDKLLDDMLDKVVGFVSTPQSTPKKRLMSESPRKRPYTPSVGSPLKKLQKQSELQSERGDAFAAQSPFNPDGKASAELKNQDSPFNVTSKKLMSSPLRIPSNSPFKSAKSSPMRGSGTASPNYSRYNRSLNLADFISFANNFYIPASVTPNLVATYNEEKPKFSKKNEWLLACGLIHAAYVRINDRLLKKTVGKKAELQDQLFQYQKGGLMKTIMIEWINRIEEAVKMQEWIIDLEMKYMHDDWSVQDTTQEREIEAKLGRGWDLIQGFGSMINPSVMFDKHSQIEYYSVWTRRVREKVKALSSALEPSQPHTTEPEPEPRLESRQECEKPTLEKGYEEAINPLFYEKQDPTEDSIPN